MRESILIYSLMLSNASDLSVETSVIVISQIFTKSYMSEEYLLTFYVSPINLWYLLTQSLPQAFKTKFPFFNEFSRISILSNNIHV